MREALKDKPNAILPIPEGMVSIYVDKRRGTETKSTNGTQPEKVREELRLSLLGPEPVRTAPASGSAGAAPRRSAPRVVDDLF
jgi:membrane carboxypeptidase/penicillin-binding protein